MFVAWRKEQNAQIALLKLNNYYLENDIRSCNMQWLESIKADSIFERPAEEDSTEESKSIAPVEKCVKLFNLSQDQKSINNIKQFIKGIFKCLIKCGNSMFLSVIFTFVDNLDQDIAKKINIFAKKDGIFSQKDASYFFKRVSFRECLL